MNRNQVLPFLLASVFCIGALTLSYAEDLEVNFSGEIVNTTCQISANSLKKSVVLENLRLKNINELGSSDTTAFSIGIEKCSPTDLQKDIELMWKSSKLVTIGGQSYVTTEGDSGVLVGLLNGDNQPIEWNTPFSIGAVSVADQEQKFDFGVFVHKPATGEAKVGDFTSIVTFSVEYK